MSITVTFAGLMLICLAGDRDCPTSMNGNTAWVVKAFDRGDVEDRSPCGWDSGGENETRLVVDYEELGVKYSYPLPEADICIYTDQPQYRNKIEKEVEFLPRLYEIDRRFVKIQEERLGGHYAPTRIHFPFAVIGASKVWEYYDRGAPIQYKKTEWHRASGEMQTEDHQYLSDKLTADYPDAKILVIGACGKDDGRHFSGNVTIRNEAAKLSPTTKVTNYDLIYLLWYYRLGYWDTPNNDCPKYGKDAVLFRCKKAWCYYGDQEGKTTFWPVMRNARP